MILASHLGDVVAISLFAGGTLLLIVVWVLKEIINLRERVARVETILEEQDKEDL